MVYSRFVSLALVCLLAGLLIGNLGALQYVLPDFLKESIPFNKTRPLHVTLMITWIFCGAIGGIYQYLPVTTGKKLFSPAMGIAHFYLVIITGAVILVNYLLGNFSGREYMEFPPWLAVPMLVTWLLFMINFTGTMRFKLSEWKIYHWMWCTGVVFFIITFGEAYLWTFDFFNSNAIRDATVQWKAMGSMVGSWNMLVYGTAFYIMEKIGGDEKVTTSSKTYFFYFLGLTNLMFNWGHHTYIVPASPWIKHTAYIISMTELLLLGNIIYSWRKSITEAVKNFHNIVYAFLTAADIWIFFNLSLAIILSIPAINLYTHGTHITVAHAMGATIGINSMILFASICFMMKQKYSRLTKKAERQIRKGMWITNISLLVFCLSLTGSGLIKIFGNSSNLEFRVIMENSLPFFRSFSISGFGIFAGILFISLPLLRMLHSTHPSENKIITVRDHVTA